MLSTPLTKPLKKGKYSIDKNLLSLGGTIGLTHLIQNPKKG